MAAELLFPKLVVFGASGPMGRLVVNQALLKGHLVCAVVRSPEKFDIKYVLTSYILKPSLIMVTIAVFSWFL